MKEIGFFGQHFVLLIGNRLGKRFKEIVRHRVYKLQELQSYNIEEDIKKTAEKYAVFHSSRRPQRDCMLIITVAQCLWRVVDTVSKMFILTHICYLFMSCCRLRN